MNFLCIADKDSSLGFRFGGIETREVFGKTDALEALKVALATEDVGVILVTEKVSSFIREEIDALIYHHTLPLILEIPSRGEVRRKTTVGEFLKQAIGISI
ncbi:MAG: V-type ATP synthase subunit F [Deltaproteobacteria bacterium]